MQLDPYLMFNGTCAEAMRFYERVLGGQLQIMTHSQMPPGSCGDIPPGNENRVMHAALIFDNRMLMASDTFSGQPYDGMKNFSLALTYPTVGEATKIFNLLAEGGQVKMPLGDAFWTEVFGMLVDRFGTHWMINGAPKKF